MASKNSIVRKAINALPGDKAVLDAFKTRVRNLASRTYSSYIELIAYMEDKQDLIRMQPRSCAEWQDDLIGVRFALIVGVLGSDPV